MACVISAAAAGSSARSPVALRIRVVEVDGRRQHLVVDGERVMTASRPAGGAESGVRSSTWSTRRQLVGVVPEDLLDGHRLEAIVVRRRGAVRVDVGDRRRFKRRAAQGHLHPRTAPSPSLRRRRDMDGDLPTSVADHLGVHPGAAGRASSYSSSDKGRLSKEEIDRMVEEAEKHSQKIRS